MKTFLYLFGLVLFLGVTSSYAAGTCWPLRGNGPYKTFLCDDIKYGRDTTTQNSICPKKGIAHPESTVVDLYGRCTVCCNP